MRVGESRLLARRDARWQRPYNALDPAVLSIEREERASNRRALRLGVLACLAVHAAALVIVFPEIKPRVYELGSQPRVYRLEQVRFRPPVQREARPAVRRPTTRTIPIPDPTPDDPEPIVDDRLATVDDIDVADAQFDGTLGIPEGPPGPSQGPIRVAGNVKAPVRVFSPDPVYPEAAREGRVQGVVILQTIIDTAGRVTDIKVLKGLPSGLTEAAVGAVSQWTFRPATLDGEPVAVYYLVTITFSVQ